MKSLSLPALSRILLFGCAIGALSAALPANAELSDGDLMSQHQRAERDGASGGRFQTASIDPSERGGSVRVDTGSDPALTNLAAAIAHARAGRVQAATEARDRIGDPVARVVAEWVILRTGDGIGFQRLAAFVREHPAFPGVNRIRQRAEGALLEDRVDPATIRAFLGDRVPTSARGRLALARALLAGGETERANRLAREIWRGDDLAAATEDSLIQSFGRAITASDHQKRLARMLHEEQSETAMRVARRLSPGHVALARAFLAIGARQANGAALLGQVPASLHGDPLYQFARAQMLRRADRTQEAAQILINAPRDPAVLGKPEEWWTERRVMVRKLLDAGDARSAYRVAAGHAVREGAHRVDAEFHAGWVALRFLNDPATALRHFEAARAAAQTPMSRSRSYFWIARAHEAGGAQGEARGAYERAARFSTHYYGQLARAHLGMTDLPIKRPDVVAASAGPIVRAIRMLYRVGERDLARTMLAEIGQRSNDVTQLHGAAEVAASVGDARGVLTLGKLANQRGLPFDNHAFPTTGIPPFRPVGADVDRAVVFAIARQESTFDPTAVSHAGARGLLQLMPATARATARAHNIAFDERRLLSDPAFNATIGSAHLGELMTAYNGSFILTFAAYNAGPARVREWIQAYGDPRNPNVDPVDWVERIPFSETRNYVQRVMENVQVYRARFGSAERLRIHADMRRGRPN